MLQQAYSKNWWQDVPQAALPSSSPNMANEQVTPQVPPTHHCSTILQMLYFQERDLHNFHTIYLQPDKVVVPAY